MTSRFITAAVAALSLVTAVAPAVNAVAQPRHGGPGGYGFHGGYPGGYGYRGGRGYRGNDAGALIGGLALGAALGYYAGRPYYCRNHRHWRWNPYYHRYVYYNGGYC
jgi:hypothetical protein